MYEGAPVWEKVDAYFVEHLVDEDDALVAARLSSASTAMPRAEVAPNQGAFLSIVTAIAGARRVLEIGTLAGYSTIWFARAVGAQGRVVTLEVDEAAAAIARSNLERAGVTEQVDLVVGAAMDSLTALIASGAEPFDLVFLDADKPNNPRYLDAALRLSRPGTVLIADNVVRNGAVVDPESDDPRVRGTRETIELLGRDDRLDATAIQTVGSKGWDGFALAVVRGLA